MTISFLTLAFAQLWHVFNVREKDSTVLNNAIIKNPFVWGALVLCSVFLALTLLMPILSTVLRVAYPGFEGMVLVLVMSVMPLVIGQIVVSVLGRKKR